MPLLSDEEFRQIHVQKMRVKSEEGRKKEANDSLLSLPLDEQAGFERQHSQ